MIKKLAWNAFKNTGDINTYLEFIETENIEKEIEKNKIEDVKNNIKQNNLDGEKWEQ